MNIQILEKINSTNDYLKENKDLLNHNFCAIWAKRQTKGRGRKENQWYCGENLDLAFSFVYHPPENFEQVTLITLYIGLAVFQFIYKNINNKDKLKIKWPNDILYDNKKLCGILCERVFINDNKSAIIAGIGININTLDFPEELKKTSVSLKQITGKTFDLFHFLREMTAEIESFLNNMQYPMSENIRFELLENSHSIGKPVKFNHDEHILTGTVKDIALDGCLIVKENISKKMHKIFEAVFL
ncbi:MAG: biotin--[acetyl-CoA-carboxylase] ligase [Spirochaetia bacterium]|nr:biotin--[acetyl-CoA-carboxylase] ligase [Spirochaetia bacterium]